MIPDYQLLHGDCLIEMDKIADNSIDMILADLPYGTSACAWDSVIPFEPLWKQYKRVIKPRGAIVCFSSQPFTSALVMSNPEWFKYEWVWDKVNLYTNFLNADKQPLKRHENILVFYDKQPTFNKQFRTGTKYHTQKPSGFGQAYGKQRSHESENDGLHHNPCSILPFKADEKTEKGLHPTQKILAILYYLILTYTDSAQLVLDSTMGSGSTGEACLRTGRRFIGIEKDLTYFGIAQRRLANVARELRGEWKPMADNGKGLEDLPMFAGQ